MKRARLGTLGWGRSQKNKFSRRAPKLRNSATRGADNVFVPRGPRYTPPGTVQHFISRIAGGEFRIRGQPERAELTRRLALAISRCDWRALAFTWMSSHEHLVSRAGEQPADTFLRPLHTGFSRWLNDRDGRFGHLYAGRPDNVAFSTEEAVANLIAYVHNNPVRAGVVADPLDSRWTTHRAYVGLEPAPRWLDVEVGLSLCGFDSTGNGRANFHDFVRARAGLPRDPVMSGQHARSMQAEVREALGANVELVPVVHERPEATILLRRGGIVRPAANRAPGELLAAVAAATGIPMEALLSRRRGRAVVEARRLALVVWTQCWNRSVAELAPALGITPQAGS